MKKKEGRKYYDRGKEQPREIMEIQGEQGAKGNTKREGLENREGRQVEREGRGKKKGEKESRKEKK